MKNNLILFLILCSALFFFVACPDDNQDSGDAGDSGDSGDAGDSGNNIVYVSTTDGSDESNCGNANTPCKTIQYTIDSSPVPSDVRISAGDYNETITLKQGVSLYGAYNPSDWNDRDNKDRTNPDYATNINAELPGAIYGGGSIDSTTIIDGFNIYGGYDTIDHNSYGIYLYEIASPTITNNTINGGSGENNSYGITTLGSANPKIMKNLINGGSGAYTCFGIRVSDGTTPEIINNLIDGGTGPDITYGLHINNSSPYLYNNTISGGNSGNKSYAVYLFGFGSPSPTIDNNIIFTQGGTDRYGIYEYTVNNNPTSLRNNDIFGCTTALYHNYSGSPSDITNISDVNNLTDIDNVKNNISVAPDFVSATDWHLQSSSPGAVKQGGIDLSSVGYNDDYDDVPRTVNWSIGAFEQD